MSARTATVDRFLRLARWPADLATSMLPGSRTGPGAAARLVVDRVDASVRASLASILGDQSLRTDAERRDAAADERERALDLRREASRRTAETESQLRERHEQAGRKRERASQNASQRRRAAAESKRRRESNAAKAQRERSKVSEAQQAVAEQRIDEQRAAAEMPAAQEQASAIRDRELAVQQRDEAGRLGEAASRVKEQRT